MRLARRAGCQEIGSSGSREAAQSNPPCESNLELLSHRTEVPNKIGSIANRATGTNLLLFCSGPEHLKWVRRPSCRVIPLRGSEQTRSLERNGCKSRELRSTPADAGSLRAVTHAIGAMTRSDDGPKKPAMKSSTVKGPLWPCRQIQSETVPDRDRKTFARKR